MQNNEIRTSGYILRRTNYGEADRILNIITPLGKITAIAKGVRKEKSKLAGGIEMFSLIDFNIHKGKSEFGIVTAAQMKKYFGNIIKDLGRIELAGLVLKKVSLAADSSDNSDYFKIVDQCLRELDNGMRLGLVESWFLINLKKAMGEEINVYRDEKGEKLSAEEIYSWDYAAETFFEDKNGKFGENEIKMLRLILKMDLGVVKKIKLNDEMVGKILDISRAVFRV